MLTALPKFFALPWMAIITLICPLVLSAAEAAEISREEAFKLLELPPDATDDQIKSQFRKLSKKFHPDLGGTADAFIKLQSAFESVTASKKISNGPSAGEKVFYPLYRVNIFDGLHGIPLKREMKALTDRWDKSVGIEFDTARTKSLRDTENFRPNLDPKIFRGYIEAHQNFMKDRALGPKMKNFSLIFNAEFIPLLSSNNPSVDHFVAAFAKQLADMGEIALLEKFINAFDFPARVNARERNRYKELREFFLADHPNPRVQQVLNGHTHTVITGDPFFWKRKDEILDLARRGKVKWESLSDAISQQKIFEDQFEFVDEVLRNVSKENREHVAQMQISFDSKSVSEVPTLKKTVLEMKEKDLPWYRWGSGELFGEWKKGNRELLLEILTNFEKEEPGFLDRKYANLKDSIGKWQLTFEHRRAELLQKADKTYKALKKELAAHTPPAPPPRQREFDSCQSKFRAITR